MCMTLQVHLAQINGEKVVVKVQRPGLKSLFDIDLKNVRTHMTEGLTPSDPAMQDSSCPPHRNPRDLHKRQQMRVHMLWSQLRQSVQSSAWMLTCFVVISASVLSNAI